MAPGLLLLRNHGTSLVYAVAYDSMAQIDLSDDDVVEAISVDDWEKDASLVPSKDGRTAGLMLNREAFYDVISVMAAAPAVAN